MNVRLFKKAILDLGRTMETAYPNRKIDGDTCTIYSEIDNEETKDILVSYTDLVFENYFKDLDMFGDGREFELVVCEAEDFFDGTDDIWSMEFTFKGKKV